MPSYILSASVKVVWRNGIKFMPSISQQILLRKRRFYYLLWRILGFLKWLKGDIALYFWKQMLVTLKYFKREWALSVLTFPKFKLEKLSLFIFVWGGLGGCVFGGRGWLKGKIQYAWSELFLILSCLELFRAWNLFVFILLHEFFFLFSSQTYLDLSLCI